MNDLEQLKSLLEASLKQYTYKIEKNLSYTFIRVTADEYCGAMVLYFENKIQVVPSVPSSKGRLKAGFGVGLGSKNLDEVANTIYAFLKENGGGSEVKLIANETSIEPTKKGKKIERVIGVLLGIGLIWIAYYYYQEFSLIEREGGEIRLNWIIALLYETLGKEVACGVLALGGVGVLGLSAKKLIYGEDNAAPAVQPGS